MHNTLVLILVVCGGLLFDFTNGFHDTANSVAPAIATKVLTPRVAVALAAIGNLVGAFLSLKVAATIASSIVDQTGVTLSVIVAGLAGAVAWNVTTWYWSLPSSSSHALIGGVIGAMLAKAGSAGVLWSGITTKVLVPGILAPVIALTAAYLATTLIRIGAAGVAEGPRKHTERVAQIGTLGLQSLAHGTNDAQKTMGILTLALIANGTIGATDAVPKWVIISCAAAIAAGTLTGGWRIIRTLGHGFTTLDGVQGLGAQMSSSVVILTSSHLGLPLSTTYVATGSVLGSGVATNPGQVRWGLARRVVAAWLITLPAAGAVGAVSYGITALLTPTVGSVVLLLIVGGYLTYLAMRARRMSITPTNVNEPWSEELGVPVINS